MSNQLAMIIGEILRDCRTIAVVGLSSNPTRPSFGVVRYMKNQGYRVIPVNPNETNVLGELAYPSLAAVPGTIDLVNIFRKSEDVLPIVEAVITHGAKAMDRCWLKEHTALSHRG